MFLYHSVVLSGDEGSEVEARRGGGSGEERMGEGKEERGWGEKGEEGRREDHHSIGIDEGRYTIFTLSIYLCRYTIHIHHPGVKKEVR